jgi:hypothetical protein
VLDDEIGPTDHIDFRAAASAHLSGASLLVRSCGRSMG